MSDTISAAEYVATAGKRKQSKYQNQITEVDGIKFRSKSEARRYEQLKQMQLAGEIGELDLQPRYPIVVNRVKICTYVADFRYFDRRTGDTVVEDVKGAKTLLYTMKRNLMLAVHGIDVREIRA